MADFLADENFPYPIVRALTGLGHRVEILSPADRGGDDLRLLKRALAGRQILLTQDTDFAELVLKGGHPCFGLVLLSATNKGGWKSRADDFARRIGAAQDRLPGAFHVLSEGGMRLGEP